MQGNCQVMNIFLTYNTLYYSLDVMKSSGTVSYMSSRERMTVISNYPLGLVPGAPKWCAYGDVLIE